MKKSLPIIIFLVVVAAAVWYSSSSQTVSPGQGENSKVASSAGREAAHPGAVPGGEKSGSDSAAGSNNMVPPPADFPDEEQEEDEELLDEDDRPAAQVYSSAEDALKAVKDGASDYNDIILEQFTQPGDDCKWCDTFYKSVRDLILAPDSSDDEKSYYSELLAISGRPENIASLVEAIKAVGDNEKGDIYAEGLELTIGGPEVVKYLGEQLNTDNELLKESLVAALTNQGTRQAAELLYSETLKKNDPDGFYGLGIGIGEFVPEEEAIPYLQELVNKHDQFSHLAVKALLNSGLDGLKVVFDTLSASKNPDADKALLKDWTDHLSLDEETEAYLKGIADNCSNNPSLCQYAKEALASGEGVAEEQMDEPIMSVPGE